MELVNFVKNMILTFTYWNFFFVHVNKNFCEVLWVLFLNFQMTVTWKWKGFLFFFTAINVVFELFDCNSCLLNWLDIWKLIFFMEPTVILRLIWRFCQFFRNKFFGVTAMWICPLSIISQIIHSLKKKLSHSHIYLACQLETRIKKVKAIKRSKTESNNRREWMNKKHKKLQNKLDLL